MTGHYAPLRTISSRLDSDATQNNESAPCIAHDLIRKPVSTFRDHARMRTADTITKKLTEAFAPQSLKVEDESHQHAGHAGHREGGQTHYRVYIVADAFKGKTRIERHRMINATLSDELAAGVHALAIHAAAPGESGI
jgi:BolA protein